MGLKNSIFCTIQLYYGVSLPRPSKYFNTNLVVNCLIIILILTAYPEDLCRLTGGVFRNKSETCFSVSDTKLRWEEAAKQCQDETGKLAQISSSDITETLKKLDGPMETNLWIGLRSAFWQWLDTGNQETLQC